jgi:hypothetical protein
MIGGRVANVIISFSRDRDDMLLANFERVRSFYIERKLLRRPAKHCLPNLAPLWATGFRANRSDVVSGGIYKRDVNVAVCFHFYVNNTSWIQQTRAANGSEYSVKRLPHYPGLTRHTIFARPYFINVYQSQRRKFVFQSQAHFGCLRTRAGNSRLPIVKLGNLPSRIRCHKCRA